MKIKKLWIYFVVATCMFMDKRRYLQCYYAKFIINLSIPPLRAFEVSEYGLRRVLFLSRMASFEFHGGKLCVVFYFLNSLHYHFSRYDFTFLAASTFV